MASSFVQNQVDKEIAQTKDLTDPKSISKVRAELMDKALNFILSIEGHISPAHIKASMYVFLKFWDRAFT